MTQETWRPIRGYEGYYLISDLGRVCSLKRKGCLQSRILKPWKDRDGYCYVGLCRDGKSTTFSVHRLVALAFVENPDGLPEINHDTVGLDKTLNHADRLQWCSGKGNQEHYHQVLALRYRLIGLLQARESALKAP